MSINPPYRFDPLQNPVDISGDSSGGAGRCPWVPIEQGLPYDGDRYGGGVNIVGYTSISPCERQPDGSLIFDGSGHQYLYQGDSYYHFEPSE